jgi:transposase-like protein
MEHEKKARRSWAPQQKFEILKDIETFGTVKEGLEKYELSYSVYRKWKRQLEVGVNASLRNSRAIKPADMRALERENRRLKEMVLNQSLMICELKKEMRLD